MIPQQEKNDNDKQEQIEGVTTVYTLDFTKNAASERATAFKREIGRALKESPDVR